jgi:hypothetical protein
MTPHSSAWRLEKRRPVDQLHRPRLADRARQPLGAARSGEHPERDLRQPELRVLGGDDHVAGERQLEAAAEDPARDRGDQRGLDGVEPLPEGVVGLTGAGRPLLGERPDVGAGGECLGAAGDDDAAHLGLGVEALERGAELVEHPGAERVAALGVVETADREVVLGSAIDGDERAHEPGSAKGRIASIPVALRPMISFWISEVPS